MHTLTDTATRPYQAPFDSLRHSDEPGKEFWSGRELAEALGYTRWDGFLCVLIRVEWACIHTGNLPSEHIRPTQSTFTTCAGAQRKRNDVHLSRLASMLVVMNANPRKKQVALGQAYFALQTMHSLVRRDDPLMASESHAIIRGLPANSAGRRLSSAVEQSASSIRSGEICQRILLTAP